MAVSDKTPKKSAEVKVLVVHLKALTDIYRRCLELQQYIQWMLIIPLYDVKKINIAEYAMGVVLQAWIISWTSSDICYYVEVMHMSMFTSQSRLYYG